MVCAGGRPARARSESVALHWARSRSREFKFPSERRGRDRFWGLAPARITRHARTCECAPESQPIRTVRHTVASHDMQYIDLCEADNMLVNTMELELLLRKHDQLANTERICEK